MIAVCTVRNTLHSVGKRGRISEFWKEILHMWRPFLITLLQRLQGPTTRQLYLPSDAKSGIPGVKVPVFILRKHPNVVPHWLYAPTLAFPLSCLPSVHVAYLTPVSAECVSYLAQSVCHKPCGPDAVLSTHVGLPLLDRLRRMRTGVLTRRSTS
jgi:hypothetical protein